MIYEKLSKILELASEKGEQVENNKDFVNYIEAFIGLIALYGDATIVKEDIQKFLEIKIENEAEVAKTITNLIISSIDELSDFDGDGNLKITKQKNVDMFLSSLTIAMIAKDIQDNFRIFFWLSNNRDHITFLYKTKNKSQKINLIELVSGEYVTGKSFMTSVLANNSLEFQINEDMLPLFDKFNKIFEESNTDKENFIKIGNLIINMAKDKILSNIKFQVDDDGNAFFHQGIYLNIPEIIKINGFETIEFTKYRKKIDKNGKLLLEKVIGTDKLDQKSNP